MTEKELNGRIADGTIDELIRVVEARQCKVLARIADDICAHPKVRLVLVAGGSSAGKTTTAKRLATQLRVNEHDVELLSTDDYFVGDARNPRAPDGSLDYEHVDCVDRALLTSDLAALFRGEEIPRRRFDFAAHEPAVPTDTMRLPAGGFVVIEGIHALNPILTADIPDEVKYGLFVEPTPTMEFADGTAAHSTDIRFLRRLVRDSQFRKMSPVKTLDLWPKVLAGEQLWINPFRGFARQTFNSYLDYEFAVLKSYVDDLLGRVRRERGDVPMVMDLIHYLSKISPASPSVVPGDSILRETIGGSQLEY